MPLVIAATLGTAQAIDVQNVTSSTGVRSWLVESHHLPIVVLDFAFRNAGSATDPVGREGLSSLGAELLTEGAGDLDAATFQDQLAEIGAVLHFRADREAVVGHLEVPLAGRERAFHLLRLALTQPQFEDDAIKRAQSSHIAALAHLESDPGYVARRTWWSRVFAKHPYGREPYGSPETVSAVSVTDLRLSFIPRLTRSTLLVGAAGAIDTQELATVLDRLFGKLPPGEGKPVVSPPKFTATPLEVTRLPFPQSACVFGQPAPPPGSADYLPAVVLNHVIGGGPLTSRLFLEMREKRGLVYSVRTSIETLSGVSLLVGGFATENAKVASALDVVKREWQRAQNGDITDDDIAGAKDYLTGSLPVSLDGTAAIAGKLLSVQRLGLDASYITDWNSKIRSVDSDTVRATARRLFRPQSLSFAIAGNPNGLERGSVP